MVLIPPNELPLQFPPGTNPPIQSPLTVGGEATASNRQRRQFEALKKLIGTGGSYMVLVNTAGIGLSSDLVIRGVHRLAEEAPTVPKMLRSIKKRLIPQVKDIAAVLGVRRPTIYAWLEGEQEPAPDRLARIQEIHSLMWSADLLFKNLDTKSLEGALVHGPLVGLLTVQPLPREQVQTQLEAIERQVRQAMNRRAARKEVDLQAFARRVGSSPQQTAEARIRRDIESGKGYEIEDGDA